MESSALEQRLAGLESRLKKIEQHLSMHSEPSWELPEAKASPVLEMEPMEHKPGNWLGMIAVLCFVLAAGFIIKLSIETGWLTPERQITLAMLFGASLIGTGLALMKSDRSYAAWLPGAGVVVLYLSAFAAHALYHLISFEVAITLTSLVSGLCIVLYTLLKHDIYPITASVGAYLSPFLLGASGNEVFALYYFVLASIGFAVISTWVQSRTLTLVSSYLALFMTAVIGIDIGDDRLVAGLLALHFFVFSVGTYFYTHQHKTTLTQAEATSFLPVLLIFYALEYHFIGRISPGMAPWISLGFAGFLTGLYLSAKQYFPDSSGSQSLIISFVTIVLFHSVYMELLPTAVKPWLFVLGMLAFTFLPVRSYRVGAGIGKFIITLAVLLVLGGEYMRMLSYLLDGRGAGLLVSFMAFASIWMVLVVKDSREVTHGYVLLAAAHLLAVVGFYRLATDHGSLAVSASWLFYAVTVMVFAFMRGDNIMAKSALFVLAFAAGKALLYDAASAPTVVRILCLLLTGVVLYGCGFLMRRIAQFR